MLKTFSADGERVRKALRPQGHRHNNLRRMGCAAPPQSADLFIGDDG